ncbi:MAG: 2-oxoglutarate dehydrogenase E1 subunit family protein, partial [Mycobacterium sp.]
MSDTSSPFGQNEWLVEEMYRKFRDDPSSVDPSWHDFLAGYHPEAAGPGNGQPTPAAPAAGAGA